MEKMNQSGRIKPGITIACFIGLFIFGLLIANAQVNNYARTMCQGPDGKWYPCQISNIPAATWTPTGSSTYTPTATSTITGTPTPLSNGLLNSATGNLDYWKDAAPSVTPTVGTGNVYDQANDTWWAANAKFYCFDKSGNTCTPTPTKTSTPTGSPTYTPTATPTPLAFGFFFSNNTSSGQQIAPAVSGMYNTLRGFSIDNSNASSNGQVYISDGTVTIWGPVTMISQTGINVDRTVYSQAQNRPLTFFNVGGIANMEITGQYSVDLPGVK